MDKVIYQDDHEQVIADAGGMKFQLYDTNTLSKSASECIPSGVVAEHRPDDNHFMMHVIAMGADEQYGHNRNGDGFPRQALVDRHDTFVKQGCFYREHKNRCPETQGIGLIKHSAYNPTMDRVELLVWGDKRKAEEEYEMAKSGSELSFSMSCFPKKTQVDLPGGESKNIEDIRQGDMVVSHKGNVCKVTHTMDKLYIGDLVTAKVTGISKPIVCTSDHPVWARVQPRAGQPCPVCSKSFKSLKAHLRQQKDESHQSYYKEFSKSTEGFWPANYIAAGDHLRTAVDMTTNSKGNAAWAKIAGYYLSDGSVSIVDKRWVNQDGSKGCCKQYVTTITCNLIEMAFAVEFADAVESLGYTRPGIFSEPKWSRIRVTSCNRELHDWLFANCGKYSYGKSMSDTVMQWEPEIQRILLGTYINGDGHYAKGANGKITVGAVTVSEKLAYQTQILFARCGISASVHRAEAREGGSVKGRQIESRRPTYQTHIHKRGDIASLKDVCGKIPNDTPTTYDTYTQSIAHLKNQSEGATMTMTRKATTDTYVEDGFIYRRVRSVTTAPTKERVYDLTVEGDHGFTVNTIGVSNCRMPSDRCNCCGNEAKNLGAYCSHLKDNMGQFMPEFKKYAYAVNDNNLKFYDISRVGKPADRIAHYLSYHFGDDDMAKAASSNIIIPGAAWAEFEQVNLGNDMDNVTWDILEEAALNKFATIEEKYTTLNKEATAFDQFERNLLTSVAPAAACTERLSDAFVKEAHELNLGGVFGELVKRSCILNFMDFSRVILGKTEDALTKDAGFMEVVRSRMPQLFTHTKSAGCKCGDAANMVTPSPFGLSLDGCSDAVGKMMDKIQAHMGMEADRASARAMRVVIVKRASERMLPIHTQSNTEQYADDLYNALASTYAAYVIKSAAAIEQHTNTDTNLMPYLVVAQNQLTTKK